ncbi:MAG: hypothetical protein D6798_00710, partial [Deltaproteobacteria bacterium]
MSRTPCSLCLWVLLASGTAHAGQRIVFQVEVPSGVSVHGLRAEVDRVGRQEVVELHDDGRMEPDIPGDGVWYGELSGGYARAAQVVLVASAPDGDRAVFGGVLRTDDASMVTLGFRLDQSPDGPVAVRIPVAAPGSGGETGELLQLVAFFGWGLLVLAWVA